MAYPDDTLTSEQLVYARWLVWGTRIGFSALVASFLLYVTETLAPAVPLDQLPRLWELPLEEYLAATHAKTGWGWLREIGKGDVLNLVGVAILSATTFASYCRVLPVFVRSRERVYVAICVVELAVLAAAASDIF